ncbi:hypothetical protein SAMN05660657_05621 [Geodermatophilus amargosae]|uniref:Uncharacterized protein n=1 Tax=Geodermatophilus amargosae TaxID=1296565 RepID=A0A1I7DCL7_9ACTN|nr:hypothetical protein [Geodermatophilus amargosae]SFU09429.1 hypothetical protein SAMN05660657_05621 [Geodermatophilus amargosae]
MYRYGACERARTWSTLADDERVWEPLLSPAVVADARRVLGA